MNIEKVLAIRDARRTLYERGERDTMDAVLALIGGSKSTINKYWVITDPRHDALQGPLMRQWTVEEKNLVPVTVHLPPFAIAYIDQHIETLQREYRFTIWSRGQALRDLILRAMDVKDLS